MSDPVCIRCNKRIWYCMCPFDVKQEDNCEYKFYTRELSRTDFLGKDTWTTVIIYDVDCEDVSIFDWCSACDNAGPLCTCDCVWME